MKDLLPFLVFLFKKLIHNCIKFTMDKFFKKCYKNKCEMSLLGGVTYVFYINKDVEKVCMHSGLFFVVERYAK